MPPQKPGKSKQDYATPWALIWAIEARYGRLEIDLAARADNAKAPRFIGVDEDSLAVPWAGSLPTGSRCWLNPPFADIEPWAAKCRHESEAPCGVKIIMLTPASVGSEWFAKHVHRHAAVRALRPRITFEGARDPYPKDCMLSFFGFGVHDFDVWRWDR